VRVCLRVRRAAIIQIETSKDWLEMSIRCGLLLVHADSYSLLPPWNK
jgi:hypothetical protein